MSRGRIHPSAEDSHFRRNQQDRDLVAPFIAAGFEVCWANKVFGSSTHIIAFLLKPRSDRLINGLGLDYEVFFAFSPFTTLEPRSIQLVSEIFNNSDYPFQGRVEPKICYFASKAQDTKDWINSYCAQHKQDRLFIPFTESDLKHHAQDADFVIGEIHASLGTADRFKITQPLDDDLFFYGRDQEIRRALDHIGKHECCGFFGLRKSGKTSVLKKLGRILKGDESFRVVFATAYDPSVRKLRWNELIRRLVEASGIDHENCPFSEASASDDLVNTLAANPNTTMVVIIDEIEFILPSTSNEEHWKTDYLDFWHSIRNARDAGQKLSVVVAGVSPVIAEMTSFDKFQNPMFGILTPIYLAGLSEPELANMIHGISKLYGYSFDDAAINLIHQDYGSHPLLSRLACHYAIEMAREKGHKPPHVISDGYLRRTRSLRDGELHFYVLHVVQEFQRAYPEEYEILKAIAICDHDLIAKSRKRRDAMAHLTKFGVISTSGTPFILCDAVRDYVAEEDAREAGRETPRLLVPQDDRQAWTNMRIRAIVDDMRTLEKTLANPPHNFHLFNPSSFPYAERLFHVEAPINKYSFEKALTPFVQCFFESAKAYGASIGRSRYFWTDIKAQCHRLHHAIHRINVYRNDCQHIRLNPQLSDSLISFLNEDLGDDYTFDDDKYWFLFQVCLDELMMSIQIELDQIQE